LEYLCSLEIYGRVIKRPYGRELVHVLIQRKIALVLNEHSNGSFKKYGDSIVLAERAEHLEYMKGFLLTIRRIIYLIYEGISIRFVEVIPKIANK
jgi:hypothetical protein